MLPDFSKEVAVLEPIVRRTAIKAEQALLASHADEIGTSGGSHHSIVTPGDIAAQEYILDQLRQQFPGVRFIAEEKTSGTDIIRGIDPLPLVLGSGLVFGVDGVDGTAEFHRQRHEWSVSIGAMLNGDLLGGAIFAPRVRDGFEVIGEKGQGVYFREGPASFYKRAAVSNRTGQEAAVFCGVDFSRVPAFNRFLNTMGKAVETTRSVGSTALGLAYAATGKIDAMIGSHSSPWDWFAGIPLVEAAGGQVQFYHYRDNGITALDRPDIEGYDPRHKSLAFIAGNPSIVPWLFSLLQEQWE